jgi:hypothetical protein
MCTNTPRAPEKPYRLSDDDFRKRASWLAVRRQIVLSRDKTKPEEMRRSDDQVTDAAHRNDVTGAAGPRFVEW